MSLPAARSIHAWAGIAYNLDALFHSGLAQTVIAVLWTLTALGAMIFATRQGNRETWLAGGFLLGGVVMKLFLIDLAHTGTIERIVSFLVVGVLMLVIGYFSPLPPKEKEFAAP